ncbi:MAG: DUF2892 domain-containing protein [Candidatus Nanohaloarchaea archaeon]
MERNVGDSDELVRILLGALSGLASLAILAELLPEGLTIPEIASPILGLVSVILLVTAFTGKCPLYSALGINTD